MKKNFKLLSLCLVAGAISLASCSKNDGETSTLQVRMTDAPTALDKVYVDIQEVRVKFNDDTSSVSGWTTMQTNAGVYNLLAFQNGTDTLIATGTYPRQSVKQIRFILGSNNTVVAGGIVFPLTIPSGSESGLKIKLNKSLNTNLETLVIDFDAAASIRQETDGSYKLRPVLKVK